MDKDIYIIIIQAGHPTCFRRIDRRDGLRWVKDAGAGKAGAGDARGVGGSSPQTARQIRYGVVLVMLVIFRFGSSRDENAD